MAKGKRFGPLSPQQQRAVEAYLDHGKMEQAMLDAGYSPETARAQMHRFFRQRRVVEAVQSRLDDEMTSREILHRLGRKARESADEQIQLRALELLGKKHKLFTDKLAVEGPNGEPISVVFNLSPAPK